ncbi:MAG: dynamin family protein [Spirochaetota bacterium]
MDLALINYFQKIKNIIDEEQLEALQQQTVVIERLINRYRHIDLVVVGQFKAGKSSFINALVGRDILPVGVIPVTSVITRLRAGERDKAFIYDENDRIIEISIDSIDNYINEIKNPKNKKGVKFVDIEIPELNKYKGIQIIDTPGVGSIWKHNTETAENYFAEIGMGIIAISVERPLSESDMDLINDVAKHCPEIIILLTKCDLYTPKQITEITQYIEDFIKKNLNIKYKIEYFSSKTNKDYYKNLFETQILIPLIKNFDSFSKTLVEYKINSLSKSCLSYLEIALQTSTNNDIENERLKNSIIDERLNYKYLYKQLLLIYESQISKTRENVYQLLSKHQKQIIELLKNKFRIDYNQWKGNLYRLTRFYESWLELELSKALVSIIDQEFNDLENIIKESREHYKYFCKSFQDKMSQNIEKQLGIKINMSELDIPLQPFRKPDVSISSTFDIKIDLLWFLFPMVLLKKFFGWYFEKKINYEVEKNVYRLTSDLCYIINKAIENIRDQTNKYISGELATIEKILINRKSKSAEYIDMINFIKKKINP